MLQFMGSQRVGHDSVTELKCKLNSSEPQFYSRKSNVPPPFKNVLDSKLPFSHHVPW